MYSIPLQIISVNCARCISLRLPIWVLSIAIHLFSYPCLAGDQLLPLHQGISKQIKQRLSLTDEEREWLVHHPVLRVGIDADFAPYSYWGENGRFQGIVPDYLTVLGDALGIRFKTVPGLSWTEILDGARSRRLDMIATAARTDDRLRYLNFTAFHISTPLVIMSRQEDKPRFKGVDDLNGKSVALVRNYAASLRVLREYPDVQPIIVETPLQGLQAVASGEAQAYVGVLGVNTHLIRKHGLSNVVVANGYDLEPTGQRFAVRKDWSLFPGILDKALSLVSSRDRNAMLEVWVPAISIDPNLNEGQLALNKLERDYIEKHQVVTMCVDPDWMPYEKIDSGGKHVGIAADYMAMFSQMLGLHIQLVKTTTWAQSEAFAQARKCDILSFLNQSEKRSKYLNFTDPYVEAPVVLVAHNRVTYLDGLKAMRGSTLGIVKGYVYEDAIKRDYPDIRIINVKSMDDALSRVSKGEIDATIASLYIVTTQIQRLGLSNLKIAGHTEFTNRFRVGVRNDDPMLLQLFQKAVSFRDPKAENEILRRWISVRLEHGVDYLLMWKVLGGFLIVVALLLYRHRMVSNYNRRLNQANDALKQTAEALQHSNDDLHKFAKVVSHDLKSPLNAIGGYADILQVETEERLDSDEREYLSRIVNTVALMSTMIDNILIATLSEGVRLTPMPLNKAFDLAQRALLADQEISKATIHCQDDFPWVLADSGLIPQLAQNLLSNAIKYRKPGVPPEVTVSAVREDQMIRVTVADNGLGIAADELDAIFGFNKRSHDVSDQEGSGVGLAHCRRIVERHGGRIWVESILGQGSRFHFTLKATPNEMTKG